MEPCASDDEAALYFDIEKAQECYHLDNNGVLSFDTKGALVNTALVEEITSAFEKLENEMKSVTLTNNTEVIADPKCYGLQLFNPAQYRLYADTCHTYDFVWQLLAGATAALVDLLVYLQQQLSY